MCLRDTDEVVKIGPGDLDRVANSKLGGRQPTCIGLQGRRVVMLIDLIDEKLRASASRIISST
jgi:hypothetical protein